MLVAIAAFGKLAFLTRITFRASWEASWNRLEDEPDVDGIPAVRFVPEGAVVGEGSSEQEKLSSASTPLEMNWT